VLATVLALLLLQQPPPASPPPADSTDEESAPPQPAPTYRLGPGVGTYNIAPGLVPPPPRVEPTGVNIENYDRRIESRFGTPDPFYEATVRGGAALAQSRQGALDGGWTLAAGSTDLYAFQLVDRGEGESLEGAWRDLRAPSARDSGFIALIAREPGRTVLRFFEPGARAPTVVSLALAADSSWRGRLQRAEPGAAPLEVTLRRR